MQKHGPRSFPKHLRAPSQNPPNTIRSPQSPRTNQPHPAPAPERNLRRTEWLSTRSTWREGSQDQIKGVQKARQARAQLAGHAHRSSIACPGKEKDVRRGPVPLACQFRSCSESVSGVFLGLFRSLLQKCSTALGASPIVYC